VQRFMALLVGILALLTTSVVCSAQTTPTTITWLVHQHPTLLNAWEGIAAEYEFRNPNVNVELVIASGNYNDQMLAMSLGGTLPDVITNGSSDLLEAGAFYDLGELMERDPSFAQLADGWVPGALESTRLGKHRVMPYAVVTNISFINVDHFDEAGVPLPSDDWDWQEYLDDARRLNVHDASGEVTRWGLMPIATNTHRHMIPWVFQAGGRLFDDMYDPTKPYFGADATREAFEFVHALRWDHNVVPQPGQPSRNFLQGGTSIWQQLPARMAQFAQTEGLNWDIRRLPGHRFRANMSGFDYIYINRDTLHLDEAWEFIKFVTSPPAQALYAPHGQIPVSMEVVLSREWQEFPASGLNKSAFVHELEVAVNREINPRLQNEITRIYTEEWRKAYDRNEIPVSQVLEEIDRRIAALLP